jgi:acyl-CoA thioesterase-1
VAAALVPRLLVRAQTSDAPVPAGTIRILCAGVSHTFGVGVEPNEAYPAQLERVLAGRGAAARVVNVGVPGQNSAQLRTTLPVKLAEYPSDIVVVWTGANNQWRAAPRLRDHILLLRSCCSDS